MIIGCGDCNGDKNLSWTRTLNSAGGKTTIKDAQVLVKVAEKLQRRIMEGDSDVILPILSYYGTGRLYAQKKDPKIVRNAHFFTIFILKCLDFQFLCVYL